MAEINFGSGKISRTRLARGHTNIEVEEEVHSSIIGIPPKDRILESIILVVLFGPSKNVGLAIK